MDSCAPIARQNLHVFVAQTDAEPAATRLTQLVVLLTNPSFFSTGSSHDRSREEFVEGHAYGHTPQLQDQHHA
jgi:hypothetical protein